MRNARRSMRPIEENGRAMARPFSVGVDHNRALKARLNYPGGFRRNPLGSPGNGPT